jgi:hypothetical protein
MIAVAEGGAIGPLITLLSTSFSITCCEAAAWAVKNIACHEENASLICEAGGIQGLVALLNRHISENNHTNALVLNSRRRLIEAIVSALGALTYTEENKYLIGHLGAIGSMIAFIVEEDSSDRYCAYTLIDTSTF